MAENSDRNDTDANDADETVENAPENAEVPLVATPDLFNESNMANASLRRNAGGTSYSESHRREENPISFKHFLNQDAGRCGGGAKPKVFSSTTRQHSLPTSDLPTSKPINRSEYSLPDFVQDHLVIEQCYLGTDATNNVNLDNLPDFTMNSSGNNDENTGTDWQVPARSNYVKFPFDLPLLPERRSSEGAHDSLNATSGGSRSCPPTSEVIKGESNSAEDES